MLLKALAVGFVTLLNRREPRGNGFACCTCWRDSDIREERIKPYIQSIVEVERSSGFIEKINRLCEPGSNNTDLVVYAALYAWLQKHPSSERINAFTPEYWAEQADMIESAKTSAKSSGLTVRVLDYGCGSGATLSVLSGRGYSQAQLHCIEVVDYIPLTTKQQITLHILQDPASDLQDLAEGSLQKSFDVVSAFSVFHHVADAKVRTSAFQNIFKMTRPGCVFLLNDWDSEGLPKLSMWYDVAHLLLWLLMGSQAPSQKAGLQIGTYYEGLQGYTSLAEQAGFESHILPEPSAVPNPIGGFSAIYRRPVIDIGIWSGNLSNRTRASVARPRVGKSTSSHDRYQKRASRPEPHLNLWSHA